MNTPIGTGTRKAIGKKAKLTNSASGPLASAGRDSLLRSSLEQAAAMRSMIQTAAYYRAEKRGFEPGHELEDWLAAEADIIGNSAQPVLPLKLLEPMTMQAGGSSARRFR